MLCGRSQTSNERSIYALNRANVARAAKLSSISRLEASSAVFLHCRKSGVGLKKATVSLQAHTRLQLMSDAVHRGAPILSKRGTKFDKVGLLRQLAIREINGRYRGSTLGILWSVLTPLLMLAVFTFVFGTVFQSRWNTSNSSTSPMEFAVILFVGLSLFQLFSDVFTRAPTLMVSNANYVTKVMFPLELLVPSVAISALTHAAINFALLTPLVFWIFGQISWTIIFLIPIVLILTLMTLGFGWFLASIGTFVRDIGQAVGTITTAMMFLSPIFFPASSLPSWIRPFINLNPLTTPITEARKVLIFGELPDFPALGIYALVAITVAVSGFYWFQRTKRAFADVL